MRSADTYRAARREAAKAEARKLNVPLYRHWLNSPLRISKMPVYVAVKAKPGKRPHQGKVECARRLKKMEKFNAAKA